MTLCPWLRRGSRLLAIGLAAGLAAQDPPPPRFLRFVDDATGLVLPGVEVQLGDAKPDEHHLVDGWLHRGPPRPSPDERRRSDPEGLVRYESRPDGERFVVLPPHALVAVFDVEGGREVRVLRAHDLTVQVVDADGRPIADLALRCGGNPMPAWTDAHGLARFAAAQPFPVGTRIAPLYWLAPPDRQIHAEVCAGERVVRMVLPRHGTLRLRFLRRGEPATVNVFRLLLDSPIEQALWGAPRDVPEAALDLVHQIPAVACKGTVIGPMAFGGAIRGVVQIGRLQVPFVVDTATTRQRELTIDVETDPPRPSVAARVRLAAGERLLSARLTAVTDVGTFRDDLQQTLGADGSVATSFDGEPLRGARFLRLHVDALVVRADGRTEGRTRTLDLARELRPELFDCGDLDLLPHAPVARGRVVDGRGEPIAKARVVVEGGGEVRRHQANAAGVFELPGPPLRGADGELVAGSVRASWAQAPSPFVGASEVWSTTTTTTTATATTAAAAAPAGPELVFVVPDTTIGKLVVELRSVPSTIASALHFELRIGDQRFPMSPDHDTKGANVVRRVGRGLPIGRAELWITRFGQRLLRREVDLPPSPDGFVELPFVWEQDFAAMVRERRVRAVAADGTALPGARLSLRQDGVSLGALPDEHGDLVWYEGVDFPVRAFVWSHGKQVVAVGANTNGTVVLPDAAALRVVLQGLPFEVFDAPCSAVLYPAGDADTLPMHGTLQRDGTIDFQAPPAGRYSLLLYREYRERILVGEIDVAADCSVRCEYLLDDASCERLRALALHPAAAR